MDGLEKIKKSNAESKEILVEANGKKAIELRSGFDCFVSEKNVKFFFWSFSSY